VALGSDPSLALTTITMSLRHKGSITSKRGSTTVGKNSKSTSSTVVRRPEVEEEDEGVFVPHHFHKVVIYDEEGKKPMTQAQKIVYNFIQVSRRSSCSMRRR